MKLFCFALLPTALAFTRLAPFHAPRVSVIQAEPLSYPTNEKTIEVGDSVPEIPLKKAGEEEGRTSALHTLFSGKTVLVGVPGAFTPTCSQNHVPGFIDAAASLEAEGVTNLAILSVNDRFVMKAWDETLGLEKLRTNQVENGGLTPEVIADGRGTIAAALGLLVDKGDMGGRCVRSAVVFDEGKVSYVGIDEGALESSSAESVLGFLKSSREAKEAAELAAKKKMEEEEAKAKEVVKATSGDDGDDGNTKIFAGAAVVAVLGFVFNYLN